MTPLSYGYNRRKSETEKRERFSENRNVVTMKIKKSERENGPKIGKSEMWLQWPIFGPVFRFPISAHCNRIF